MASGGAAASGAQSSAIGGNSGSRGQASGGEGGTFPKPVAEAPNQLDVILFGNAASETAHAFNANDTTQPPSGANGLAQSFRQPQLTAYQSLPDANAKRLTFTLKVDPTRQNYLTIKLWGNDTTFGIIRLAEADKTVASQLDSTMGGKVAPFVGRFHYATTAIPLAVTMGKTTTSLTLYATGNGYDAGTVGAPSRPIYAAYTHVPPRFVLANGERQGNAPVQTGYLPVMALDKTATYAAFRRTRNEVLNPNASNGFFAPEGWLNRYNARQVAAGPGVPKEVVGLSSGQPYDITTEAWVAAHPGASAADWRARAKAVPEGDLRILQAVFLLKPFSDENGVTNRIYDRYLDPALLTRLISLLDGMTYLQTAPGGFETGGGNVGCINEWAGLTSTARTSGPWAGATARQVPACVTFEGEGTKDVGLTFLHILADPAAATLLRAQLDQSFDADLSGGSMKRAFAYERMLSRHVAYFLAGYTPPRRFGGTTLQNMINMISVYANNVALQRLQALYPNPTYAAADSARVASLVRQSLGIDPVVDISDKLDASSMWYVITRGGLGESYGTASSGYDGRYGSGLPSYAGVLVEVAGYDQSLTAGQRTDLGGALRNLVQAFDHFIYPQHNVTVGPGGAVKDVFTLAQEDVISYRVPYGPNANGASLFLNVNLQAADPIGLTRSALAMRSLYLAALYNQPVNSDFGARTARPMYEPLVTALINVDPGTITPLPGEPGQPDFAWADIDAGAVAVANGPDRLFVNANFDRPLAQVNHFARIHLFNDQIDHQATVVMPHDVPSVQDDGNFSGGPNQIWIVRYGSYLIALNRGTVPYQLRLPPGNSGARELHRETTLAPGSLLTVPTDDYAVLVF